MQVQQEKSAPVGTDERGGFDDERGEREELAARCGEATGQRERREARDAERVDADAREHEHALQREQRDERDAAQLDVLEEQVARLEAQVRRAEQHRAEQQHVARRERGAGERGRAGQHRDGHHAPIAVAHERRTHARSAAQHRATHCIERVEDGGKRAIFRAIEDGHTWNTPG